MNLCTLEEAKHHLRIDGDDSDPRLNLMIPAASRAILRWLKEEWRAFVLLTDSNGDVVVDSDGVPEVEKDSDGVPVVDPQVKYATLFQLAHMDQYASGHKESVTEMDLRGYALCPGATLMLNSLRRPTLA